MAGTTGTTDRGRSAGRAWVGDAAKVVKGMLVALALDAVLSDEPDAAETLLAIVGAVAALMTAELFGSVVAVEFERGRRCTLGEVAALARTVGVIALGAVPSVALFALAWFDVISVAAAASIALWSGVALLACLGVVTDTGSGTSRALHGAQLAALGLLVLVVKHVA